MYRKRDSLLHYVKEASQFIALCIGSVTVFYTKYSKRDSLLQLCIGSVTLYSTMYRKRDSFLHYV